MTLREPMKEDLSRTGIKTRCARPPDVPRETSHGVRSCGPGWSPSVAIGLFTKLGERLASHLVKPSVRGWDQ